MGFELTAFAPGQPGRPHQQQHFSYLFKPATLCPSSNSHAPGVPTTWHCCMSLHPPDIITLAEIVLCSASTWKYPTVALSEVFSLLISSCYHVLGHSTQTLNVV